MSLDKISVTLYDLLGYLLPGYVLLFALSVMEGTFLTSTVLSLSNYGRHPVPFTVAAYFLGQISHSLASQLQIRAKGWFTKDETILKPFVVERVQHVLEEMYHLRSQPDFDARQAVQLADGYVLASGGSPERDILQSREGFFKASMMAFSLCSLTLFSTLTKHGVHIRVQPQLLVQYGLGKTIVFALVLVGIALLFRLRFNFFRCLRENMSLVLFLAYREKDVLANPVAPETEKHIEIIQS